jgi:hypothetical protein
MKKQRKQDTLLTHPHKYSNIKVQNIKADASAFVECVIARINIWTSDVHMFRTRS